MELDPMVLNVIRELEYLRLKIHVDVYRFHACKHLKEVNTKLRFNNEKLIEAGFPPVLICDKKPSDIAGLSESENRKMSQDKIDKILANFDVEEMTEISLRIDEYTILGLGNYVDSTKRAFELDLRIRQLVGEANFEINFGHWHVVLMNVIEAIKLFIQRNELFPLWPVMEGLEQAKSMKRGIIFYSEDVTVNSEFAIVMLINRIEENLTHEHAKLVSSNYKFYSRYLDEELEFMLGIVLQLGVDSLITSLSSSCYQWVGEYEGSFHEKVPVLKQTSLLVVYRVCLILRLFEMANTCMHARFGRLNDCEAKAFISWLSTMTMTATATRNKLSTALPAATVQLNGSHSNASRDISNDDYRLPVNRKTLLEPITKPWWVQRFRVSRRQQEAATCSTHAGCDTQATTRVPRDPSTYSTRQNHPTEDEDKQFQQRKLNSNKEAAIHYTKCERLSDDKMCKIHFDLIDAENSDRLIITWNDFHGHLKERKTNLQVGGMYHCRSFSYDALNDEWSGRDDYCKIGGLLSVKEIGGLRVPIWGDSGTGFERNALFKVYREESDHKFDSYLAEVRAQTIALYYVDRFQEKTEDKFGCLRMLHVELFLLFESSERKQIIEFMTRERHIRSKEYNRSAFIKLTNNAHYKNINVKMDLFEAFSHFSYDESGEVLMVTDLQGFSGCTPSAEIDFILTDPVIHCPMSSTHTFGATNYGLEGMADFFTKVHRECNDICRHLKLKRPQHFDDMK